MNIDNIKDYVKGVCRLVIEDEKGEKVVDIEKENTLNINFIWDMCRQQLVRTNTNKRNITTLGGVILTNTNYSKNAYYPCVLGDVAGYCSLYNNSKSETNLKQGYSDSAETQCKDGEFTFTFKWGPTKEIGNFNNIWLYAGNHGELSENGGFHGLVPIASPKVQPSQNSILGQSSNSYLYCLYNNIIYQYKVIADNNTLYNFVLLAERTIDSSYNSYSTVGDFSVADNKFVVLSDNKLIKINVDGKVEKVKELTDGGTYGYSTASVVCINNYVVVMNNGIAKAYNISDLSYSRTLNFGDNNYGEQSSIYRDGSDCILYVFDYNVTTQETQRTDIFLVDSNLSTMFINSFYYNSNAKNGKTLYPISTLGNNIFYDTYTKQFYNNFIFPCSQDVILNGGTGELLTFNKPLGYSAKVIYKIFFDFDDKKQCENQKINPRAFQDMFLNMLLPSDDKTEGINCFGSFMVVDNEKNEGLTTAHTKKNGFANLYSQDKSPYLPTTQGVCDMSGCYINRMQGILQYKYEFDYNVANGHVTHIQTATNNMKIDGMNSSDGRCYAPKKIAKFESNLAKNLINTHGHKIFLSDARSDASKCYILSKSAKNTIYELNLNFFDREYISITQNSGKNAIILQEVNLNDEEIHQVIYITSLRKFLAFSDKKIYFYDESWNFIEHKPLPFVDSLLSSAQAVTYHGGMQNLYGLTKTADNKPKIFCYNFVENKMIWEVEDFGFNFEEICAMSSDDEYIYINAVCNINTLTSCYFLVYKITKTGLELETYNQSRRIYKGSLISTRGLLTKHCFIETNSEEIMTQYREDLDDEFTTREPAIHLSKSLPYITATHKLTYDATKTTDDFFEGIFQMKI